MTGDLDLAAQLADLLLGVIDRHTAGTRYGIRVDPSDALLTQGRPGYALTWMDARVDGQPVTPRAGKAVEINALWINGLATGAMLLERAGKDATQLHTIERRATKSFQSRFWDGDRCLDLIDGSPEEGRQMRPNSILAASLPYAPLAERRIIERCGAQLLTSLGLRSLDPDDSAYRGLHRGSPTERDRAYHQGTVWPWLIGPYAEAALRTGIEIPGLLDGLRAHLCEWGLGSVSETADGDPPHRASGCPFQAWSVAELLRAKRMLARAQADGLEGIPNSG